MKRVLGGLLPIVLVAACAMAPRPRVLGQADAVAASPAAGEAQALAPQAFLHAEKLRQKAERAYRDDALPVAQIYGEHAIAAYQHAFVLARLAKAEERRASAQTAAERAERTLREIDEQQQRVAAEADDLELRIRVARDLEPLGPNEPAAPKREQARLAAARSLAVHARLLCASTRLLDPQAEGLAALEKELEALATTLATPPAATPLDDAVRLRSACLTRLTQTRRAATRQAPAAGAADALLDELGSAGGLMVFRDDRGVVVTLRGLAGKGEDLEASTRNALAVLARSAKAHPDFPVLVVVHGPKGGSKQDAARGEAMVAALRSGGAPRVELQLAADAQPVVDPGMRGAAERNVRVEVVFVAPAF